MTPNVLLVATCRWFTTARLAMALTKAGCVVSAVCPSGHPLSNTDAVRLILQYNGLTPLRSLCNAVQAANPDLLIPCDDLAAHQLHQMYQKFQQFGNAGEQVRALIRESLGAPEWLPKVYARATFMGLAANEGIRVPTTALVSNTNELRKCISRMGLPIVLKADGTSGGVGVRVSHTLAEAERAFEVLHSPPLWARALKRAVQDRDVALLWPTLKRRRPVVNAQVYVRGREATSTVACWKGSILAGLHFEVLGKATSVGHATVLRLIENPEMTDATESIVRRLNLSGIHGFDFMLAADTGNAYLIEMNPRATQVGHLTLGPGRDIPGALYAVISGDTLRCAPTLTANDTIALFPQEWKRNPHSSFLQSSYHDVPWDEPNLVEACVHMRQTKRPWYFHSKQQEAFSTVSACSSYVWSSDDMSKVL